MRISDWSSDVCSSDLAARIALDRGQREIVLSGVDLASYGDDSGTSLAALVEALLALPIERLRLSSLAPARIADPLFALLPHEPRVITHVHLPTQAGVERILQQMKRTARRRVGRRWMSTYGAWREAATYKT